MEIARTSRSRVQNQGQEKLQKSYRALLNTTGQVVAQARRVGEEVKKGVKISADVIDQLQARSPAGTHGSIGLLTQARSRA